MQVQTLLRLESVEVRSVLHVNKKVLVEDRPQLQLMSQKLVMHILKKLEFIFQFVQMVVSYMIITLHWHWHLEQTSLC